MVLYPDVPERNTSRQSLVAVYLHSMIYYDNIYSTFALILQYFLFVYKYNILFYDSSAIAAELILLSVLFLLNFFRSFFARTGNKGKKYGYLCTALLLHALLVAGYVYILALQSNALYL